MSLPLTNFSAQSIADYRRLLEEIANIKNDHCEYTIEIN
jgi:hypothetical protein